jgi:hypothetical protein
MLGLLLMAMLAPIAATLIQLAMSHSREYFPDSTGAGIAGSPFRTPGVVESPRLWPLTHGPMVARRNGLLLTLTGILFMAPLPCPDPTRSRPMAPRFWPPGVWSATALSCWLAM